MNRVSPTIIPGLAAAVVALAFLAGPSKAQGQGDPERGKDVADKVCAFCHMARPGAPMLQGTADVPKFPEIAKREGLDADYIAGKIMAPPHPMPPVALTKQEIADVAAYILGLKN